MKKLTLVLSMLCLAAGSAGAEVLWDQSTPDPSLGGVNDSQSGCAPQGNTTFLASDVTFTDDVTIESITTWYTSDDPDFPVYASEAYVWAAPKTGSTPVTGVDDPILAPTVPITVTTVGDYREVTASGLSITLPAGDYWVGLTPIALTPLGLTDQHMASVDVVGDSSGLILYCGSFPPEWFSLFDLFGIAVDVTLRIEGTMGTVGVESGTWGQVKALYR